MPTLVAPHVNEYGVFTGSDAAKAVLLCTAVAAIAGFYSYKRETGRTVSAAPVCCRATGAHDCGDRIFTFRAQDFFGGDAMTYDLFGHAQMLGWGGDKYFQALANRFVQSGEGSGWGIVYFVAAIYGIIGRNMLAVQLLNAVMGWRLRW